MEPSNMKTEFLEMSCFDANRANLIGVLCDTIIRIDILELPCPFWPDSWQLKK